MSSTCSSDSFLFGAAAERELGSAAMLETDYLVIGAGATAMAFVDTLLSEQPDATVLMTDRHHRPGGHWNEAYPFVRLHQPSESYGVASRELSDGVKDATGLNAGLSGLASGAKILAYFDDVMQQRFLPSGRVKWLPMSDCSEDAQGAPRVRSLTNGESRSIRVRRKIVDATHAQTAVPSTHPPKYQVAPRVDCVPLNRLPEITRPYAVYTVVGSGKTGMDAVLWLLEHDVAASCIRWIMPRDAWFLNRANFQPGVDNYQRTLGALVEQFSAISEASSLVELFDRLEARELLLRLDKTTQPSTYRCAIISLSELAELRRIKDIVRMGHVRRITPTEVVMDHGGVPAEQNTLYVDCSACALVTPPALPIFNKDRINLLMVRTCQPLFSAALIAYVESRFVDPAEKNALCAVVPSPAEPMDWLRMWAVSLRNAGRWRQHAGLSSWLMQCRLNGMAGYLRGVSTDDPARLALLREMGATSGLAATRLPKLMAGTAS